MLEKLKGFAKDSILYGIGDGLGRLTNILLLPLISRLFTPADYGVIDLLTITYYFLLMTLNLNVLTGIQKYYYKTEGERRRTMLFSATALTSIFIACFTVILVCFSRPLAGLFFGDTVYAKAVIVLAFCLPLEFLYESFLLLLRLNRKTVSFSVINAIQVGSVIILTFAFVVILRLGLIGVFLAKLVTLSMLVLVLAVFHRKEFSPRFDGKTVHEMIAFALPGQPALIIQSVMELLPRYVLVFFTDLTQVGLFGVAFRIATLVNIFVLAFNRAWNPFAFSHFGKPDEKFLYQKIFKVFFASLCFLGLTLTIFAKEFLIVLTPAEYHRAYLLVGGICVYLGLRGVTLIFSTGLYSVNKAVYTSYLNLVQIIAFFISSYFLVPRYHAAGLVGSLMFSIVIYFIAYYAVTMRYFRFPIDLPALAVMSAYAIAATVIFDLTSLPPLTSLGIKPFFLLTTAVIFYFIVFTLKERSVINTHIIKPLYIKISRVKKPCLS